MLHTPRSHPHPSPPGAGLAVAALGVAIGALLAPPVALAQTVTAPGYVYSYITLPNTTQSCVASGPDGAFVGQGPGFTGNGQSIIFVSESGATRTLVSGFNSIADCAYARDIDVLYVVDNGLEAPGSVTGDTLFAIPSASIAQGLIASALSVLPKGSIASPSSVALDSKGDIFVSDATGAGTGTVRKIRASNGAMSTFATGFDFTGGLLWLDDGTLLVAETLNGLQTQINRYDALGDFLEIVSGPGLKHGSYDLALDAGGRVLVTGAFGGSIVSVNESTGVTGLFASGFSFATAIDVNSFTGRVALVSSSFIPTQEDFRLHLLTPINLLDIDGGRGHGHAGARRECLSEVYGIQLDGNKRGKRARRSTCVDGEACDSDHQADGVCRFPLGVCFNVDDQFRAPACHPDATTFFELKKAKPAGNLELQEFFNRIVDAVPIGRQTCFFSDGIPVQIRHSQRGRTKRGKQIAKFESRSSEPRPEVDIDVVRMICKPPKEPAS